MSTIFPSIARLNLVSRDFFNMRISRFTPASPLSVAVVQECITLIFYEPIPLHDQLRNLKISTSLVYLPLKLDGVGPVDNRPSPD